jgi:hypothetical protein
MFEMHHYPSHPIVRYKIKKKTGSILTSLNHVQNIRGEILQNNVLSVSADPLYLVYFLLVDVLCMDVLMSVVLFHHSSFPSN